MDHLLSILTRKDSNMYTQKAPFGCSFAILGDSYSTFEGWIPEGYEVYYPRPEMVADVLSVEHTWWHLLMTKYNMELLLNEAYSGSTVCTQVREKHPQSASFVERVQMAFSGERTGKQPDYIFLFGGTNDSWLGRRKGRLEFRRWTDRKLRKVIPAYCFVLSRLTKENPNSQIVAIVNTELHPKIREAWLKAGERYGVKNVALQEIDKQNGHPTKLGMEQIARQVEAALLDK